MVVWRQSWNVVECLTTTLLLIVHSVCQWKNFENRSIFDEDIINHKVGRFRHSVDDALLCSVQLRLFACQFSGSISWLRLLVWHASLRCKLLMVAAIAWIWWIEWKHYSTAKWCGNVQIGLILSLDSLFTHVMLPIVWVCLSVWKSTYVGHTVAQ